MGAAGHECQEDCSKHKFQHGYLSAIRDSMTFLEYLSSQTDTRMSLYQPCLDVGICLPLGKTPTHDCINYDNIVLLVQMSVVYLIRDLMLMSLITIGKLRNTNVCLGLFYNHT